MKIGTYTLKIAESRKNLKISEFYYFLLFTVKLIFIGEFITLKIT